MRNLVEYHRPRSVAETMRLLRRYDEGVVFMAGGTDLLLQQPPWAEVAIDVEDLPLGGIAEEEGTLRIGSGVRISEIAATEALSSLAGGILVDATRHFATPQVRNRATVGGNLAGAIPSADLPPPLIALDARIRIQRRRGKVLPLERFYLAPRRTVARGRALILEVDIRDAQRLRACKGAYVRLVRTAHDMPLVSAAVVLEMDGDKVSWARVVLGAVAPVPMRIRRAERFLRQGKITEPRLKRLGEIVAEAVRPITDHRATEAYRRRMAGVFVRRAVRMALDRGAAEPGPAWAPPAPAPPGRSLPATKGDGRVEFSLRVNGRTRQVQAGIGDTLLRVLRNLGAPGTKYACGAGDCGACTVLLDGVPVNSCMIPAVQAAERDVSTIESFASVRALHPIQQAFLDEGAVQCGYCTPGMLLNAKSFLDRNPQPTEQQVCEGMAGVLCRCTGYVKPIRAVLAAAEKLRADGGGAA